MTSVAIQALTLGRRLAVSGLEAVPPRAIPRLLVIPPVPRPLPDAPPSAPACDTLSPLLLAEMGPKTRDPSTLVARAEALAAAGMPLTIVKHTEPRNVGRHLGFSVEPIRCDARTLALRVHAQNPIAAAKWGLLEGDLVVAVNGHAVEQATHAVDAATTARRENVAILEVDRANRRFLIVLPVEARPAPRTARVATSP